MRVVNSEIKKILVISLTNIGDVILTFPVIDQLKEMYPNAEMSLVVGPKAQSFFKDNPNFKKVHIYNKRQAPLTSIKWVIELHKERFDLVVDLKNSLTTFLVTPRYRTSFVMPRNKNVHKLNHHLNRLKEVCPFDNRTKDRKTLYISEHDKEIISEKLKSELGRGEYVVVAPGAAHTHKRWTAEGYAKVCDEIARATQLKVVFAGDENDRKVAFEILKLMNEDAVNLCGQTTLVQLTELMQRSQFVFTNDSAPMHLASYLDKPVLAIFGPSNPVIYGPWSSHCRYIKSEKVCPVCSGENVSVEHSCMTNITYQDVLNELNLTSTQMSLSNA